MVFVPPKDRVLEHSTSNSQTVFTVTGALDTSYNAFSASMAVGDTTYGAVVEPGTAFKSGTLTYNAANQITVDSSTGESKGTFTSSGIKEVFMGLPAGRAAPPSITPQGRLTLVTAAPVMTSTQSGKTTLYYTPYVGSQVPLYNGADFIAAPFSELSVATTDTSKNPAAIGASKINDWFVWNDAGTMRLSHGPDWTNDTTRSAGTALVTVGGINLNSVAITNGPGASRGTWVGTTRSNGSSQLDWILGGSSSTAGWFGVWNTYNRRLIKTQVTDGSGGVSYTTVAWRSAFSNANNRVSYVCGLAEDYFEATYLVTINSPSANLAAGVGYDVTNASSGTNQTGGAVTMGLAGQFATQSLGFHFMQATELGGASGTFYGGGLANSQAGLTWTGMM